MDTLGTSKCQYRSLLFRLETILSCVVAGQSGGALEPAANETHGRLLVLEALGETLMLVRLLWQWSGRRFSWGGFTLHKVRTRSCDRPDLAQGGCRPPVFGRFSEFESRVYRHAQEQTMHNISTHANKLGTWRG